MNRIRIVIAGGGYAGIHAAKRLHKAFKHEQDVDITLVDKHPYHTLMTELHEVAGSRVEEDAVKISFARIFAGKRVNVATDKIQTVDFDDQVVIGEFDRYPYDYLVVGLGSEPEFFGIPGIQEHSLTLWSLDDAVEIRRHVESMYEAAAEEPDDAKRRELLTFVVAGAGFTGIELAGELLEQRKQLCERYRVDFDEVRVVVVEALDSVCTMLPENLRTKAEERLRKMGAEVLLNSRITEAGEDHVVIQDGEDISTRTFVWTCGVGGSSFAGNLDLTKGKCSNRLCQFARESGTCGNATCQYRIQQGVDFLPGKRGRLLANAYMQSTDYSNVYVVGDNVWFVEDETPLPQIVETALQTGETAAENIIRTMRGSSERKEFESNYHGFMVSIGSKYGVADVAGMKLSGFTAIAMKHMVNLHYLWTVAGFNACWGYLKHEFFTIKNRRSIVGGMAAATAPSFMLFPLRLFLGAKWLIEGVKKVTEGWLSPGSGSIFRPDTSQIRLPGVSFSDDVSAASEWVEEGSGSEAAVSEWSAESGEAVAVAEPSGGSVVVEGAEGTAEATADATSAATEWAGESAEQAADQVAEQVTEAVSETATDAVTAATEWAAETAGDAPEALMDAIGPYTWFAENILSASPALSFWLQIAVVLAEIAVGLALIGGFFTTIAAAVSILLGVMFIFSGWGNPELLWYLVAAVTVLIGAGRFAGLDYYSVPIIKRFWNRRGIAHKTYLYVDEPRPLAKKLKRR